MHGKEHEEGGGPVEAVVSVEAEEVDDGVVHVSEDRVGGCEGAL